MAKPSNTLIGRTRGSIGSATFTVWRGINVLKEKAQNLYSNPTTTQLENNSKFAVMVQASRDLAAFVVRGFKAMAVKKTDYNAFMSANPYSTAVAGSSPNYYIDNSVLKISQGPLQLSAVTDATKSAQGANGILVEWSPTGLDSGEYNFNAVAIKTSDGTIAARAVDIDGSVGDLTLTDTGLGTNIANYKVLLFAVKNSTGDACDSVIVPTE